MRYVSPGDRRIASVWGLHGPVLEEEPRVIIDCGAYIGYVALCFREWWPEAEIHCFEPVGVSFEALVENTEGHDIHVYNYALWDEECELTLGMEDAGAKNLGRMSYLTTASRAERVRAIRLDSMDFGTVDFIKMDCESSEEMILRGALGIIERDWPVLEVEGTATRPYIESLGYSLFTGYQGDRIYKKT